MKNFCKLFKFCINKVREPCYIRDLKKIASGGHGITYAVAEIFRKANICVKIIGDTSTWAGHDHGAIFVGDHRNGIEYAPMMAMFGNMGRRDVHFVAKPFSIQARIMNLLDDHNGRLILPVIPSTLSSDRKNKFNRDLFWRILHRKNLPTKNELMQLNTNTLHDCVEILSSGEIVVLYPAGGVMCAMKHTWRRGIGTIIKNLSAEAQKKVIIVPFRFDNFSRLKLISSLRMQSHAMQPHPYNISLRLGRSIRIANFFGDTDKRDVYQITKMLHQQFIKEFDKLPSQRS